MGTGTPGARRTAPSALVELLRLTVVVFLAGVGFQVGAELSTGRAVLGPFTGTALGVIVGSGLGYAAGGAFARGTTAAARRAATSLHDVSVEDLLSSAVGLVLGVVAGAAVAWPVFLLGRAYLSTPLFLAGVITTAFVGQQLAVSRGEAVVGLLGGRGGVSPRPVPVAARPRLVDTSVAIDGRVLDVVRAGFLHGELLVCAPVLGELQAMADSGDDLRRAKGRRGLATLEALQREPGVRLRPVDDDVPAVPTVDGKLVRLSLDHSWALLTLDTNLARAAALAGVAVMNVHALALALRPPVQAGDTVTLRLLRPGKEPGQGVGYLDDGSMVVVEDGADRVGQDVTTVVASVLVTANGRLVFARPDEPDELPSPVSRAVSVAPLTGTPVDLAGGRRSR